MPDDPHHSIDYLCGRLDELHERQREMGQRLDSHISLCTNRFGVMIATIAAATAALAAVLRYS